MIALLFCVLPVECDVVVDVLCGILETVSGALFSCPSGTVIQCVAY